MDRSRLKQALWEYQATSAAKKNTRPGCQAQDGGQSREWAQAILAALAYASDIGRRRVGGHWTYPRPSERVPDTSDRKGEEASRREHGERCCSQKVMRVCRESISGNDLRGATENGPNTGSANDEHECIQKTEFRADTCSREN
ncbi:hypothetical protein HNY73_011198 [Argiope bruennichi]|uniref:Uncharacterized protein n=1 Tax=Argiope bruennichi TaxID=94029 RepID=A0A8T0F5Z4_ARGBR|nr:hypothetical protein HNY73_011198 [Argiope bruennichi]